MYKYNYDLSTDKDKINFTVSSSTRISPQLEAALNETFGGQGSGVPNPGGQKEPPPTRRRIPIERVQKDIDNYLKKKYNCTSVRLTRHFLEVE